MLQELVIDLDLTAVFSLKKGPDSSPIEHIWNIHALKNLTFQFTPVTHMVYLEIRLHYLDFAIEKLTSSNWISKYTMCVTGVNWKAKFLSTCKYYWSSKTFSILWV